jgi:hypothetical protein
VSNEVQNPGWAFAGLVTKSIQRNMKSRSQKNQTALSHRHQGTGTRRIITEATVGRLLVFLVVPVLLCAQSARPARYQYLFPLPNSTLVNAQTNIIIRFGDGIDRGSVKERVLRVVGSATGEHDGKVSLSDDNRTIVFRPVNPFADGESVTVEIGEGFRTDTGRSLPTVSYAFAISPIKPSLRSPQPFREGLKERVTPSFSTKGVPTRSAQRGLSARSLPATFPPMSVFENSTPAGDPLFLSNFSFDTGMTTPYLMILNRNAEPMFYRQMPSCWDFKLQPTGTLTYYDEFLGYFIALDSSYHVVDQYMCGNGCNTNEHELQLLPNGHAYLMAYDGQIVRMDTVVAEGNPNAMVFGLIIQEIDLNKEVVFEWRSWDHFKITDALREDLTGIDIDYVHGNAIAIESDGNLLISSRNMDEVTKIDRTTGDIIWRLGGKNNQFTFVNDPDGFNAQHDIRRLANGHVTLFDNGTYRGYSRAVEYELDENALTATLVWEYRHAPDILGWALGSTQRLPDGNTLIGWGSANPTVSEVTPDGREVYEMDLPEAIFSYRVFSHPWKTNAFVPAVDVVVFPEAPVDDSSSFELVIGNPTNYDITLTSLSTRSSVFTTVPQEPLLLAAHDSIRVSLLFQPKSYGSFSDTLEIWSEDDTQGIVQRVHLAGTSFFPAIRTDPSSLSFGDLLRGASKQLTVRMLNTSGGTLLVDSIYTTQPEFVVNKHFCSVATEDSVTVTFTPPALEDFKDTLYLKVSSAGLEMKVALSGASPAPLLSVSEMSLNFGSVRDGDTATLGFTARNRSINPLTITTATLKGNAFAALHQTPTIIPGNDSLATGVRFTPTSPGTYADTLILASDGGTMGISLRGTSSMPTLATDPSTLIFGDVLRGTTKQLTMRIVNTSAFTLLVDSIYTKIPEFTVNTRSCSVDAIDSIVVAFAPGVYGESRDTLYLHNNSAVPLVKVVLSGASPAPVLSVSSTSLTFASIKSGDSTSLTLTLRNRSINALTVTGATVKGNVFSALLQTPAGIPGKDSLAASVRFSPKAVGTFTDTLVIVSDGGTERVLLRGTASDPTAGIERTPDAVPSAYSLSQNYPNPFNPSTTILFGIPEASGVTLTLYDITGRQVSTLVQSQLAPGYYRCVWNAAGSASGMYLYRLTATPVDGRSTQGFSQVKKLLLLQ